MGETVILDYPISFLDFESDHFPEIQEPGYSWPILTDSKAFSAFHPEGIHALRDRGVRVVGPVEMTSVVLSNQQGDNDVEVSFDTPCQSLIVGEGGGLKGTVRMSGEGAFAVFSGIKGEAVIRLTLVDGARAFFGRDFTSISSVWTIFKKRLVVGDDTLCSWEVFGRNHDAHTLVDLETDEFLSVPNDLILGPHCWIGQRVYIAKGVHIEVGAVIGACSVVTRDVPRFCAVAGSPARIVRQNIGWSRSRYGNANSATQIRNQLAPFREF